MRHGPTRAALLFVAGSVGCQAETPTAAIRSKPLASAARAVAPSPNAGTSSSGAAPAGSSAGPGPHWPNAAARRVTAPVRQPAVSSVILGERWGCAALSTAVDAEYQCWAAPGAPSQRIEAWKVPWLHGKRLQAGPDRVCDWTAPGDLTFRCWQHPTRGATQGTELPANEEWLNPNHATWDDAYSRGDRVGETFVGGTFSCLQETRDKGVWCLGDNRFGQLGGSSPVPPPTADRNDPAFVANLWPAQSVHLGTWHACALAAPDGFGAGGSIACWGRGDYGQLGGPAPDRCEVDGASVPCAQKPVTAIAYDGRPMELITGDLYSCESTDAGIACWGASRDGFFGTASQCPPILRRAYPTLHGSVSAPHATCSRAPAKVRGVRGFQRWASAGPRGLCFDDETPLKCIGGIRTPRGKGITGVVVSLGEDAAACGLRDGGVVCWGEGYSPPDAPDVPVPIALEPPARTTETAFTGDEDVSKFSAACLARRGCDFGPSPVPACPPSAGARDWASLRATASEHVGELVSVEDVLAVGALALTLAGCLAPDGIGCCNRRGGPVVLGDSPALELDKLYCTGDDSGACCNAPAYGQRVIARGRLEAVDRAFDRYVAPYKLRDVTLCEPK